MSTTTQRADLKCPHWCHERDDARHVANGTDHYDAPFRTTPATAGTPLILDSGALVSIGSVAVYQERTDTTPYVDLDVSEVNGEAVETRGDACLRLRPDEARKLGQHLIDAANVLDA